MNKKSVVVLLLIGALALQTTTIRATPGQWSSSGSTIYYNESGGKIGVGTSSPADPIHVHTPGVAEYDTQWGKMMVGNNQASQWIGSWVNNAGSASNNIASNAYLNQYGWFRRKGGFETWMISNYITNTNQGNFEINYSAAGGTDGSSFTTPPMTKMFKINSAGKVYVNELVVKKYINPGDWPDYVFENDYQKMSLNEIEKFVKENKHLPNIPSAAEVVENGISVGEMQAKQLEKIEELTLHLIEKDKQIDELSKRLSKIEALLGI